MQATLSEINAMDRRQFVDLFGDVAEHSPWVAEAAAKRRPYADREAIIEAFVGAVRSAPVVDQLELLRAHPDLAGKARAITDASRLEQRGAGLDALSESEFDRFEELNARYRANFGFPFILAVRGATKEQILAAFEQRIGNSQDAELDNAIEQVCRILRFRLEEKVQL
jgi:2-oxo-4-hydroxy-4-carboxy-5-ureidoimidazoline decarboxylase